MYSMQNQNSGGRGGSGENTPTFGAAGAGVEHMHQGERAPPKNARDMMGEKSGGKALVESALGKSFFQTFKGLDISSKMKERTKAASASLSDKMNSLGNSIMSAATKSADDKRTDEAGLPASHVADIRKASASPSTYGNVDTPFSATVRSALPTGQLRCFSCAMIMAYPPNVLQVKCPGCSTVNSTPPAAAPTAGAADGGGEGVFSATTHVGAGAGCMHVSCLGCGARLEVPAGSPAVACPRCTLVTDPRDPRANSTLAAPRTPGAYAYTNPSVPTAVSGGSSARSDDEMMQEAIRRSMIQEALGNQEMNDPRGPGGSSARSDDEMIQEAIRRSMIQEDLLQRSLVEDKDARRPASPARLPSHPSPVTPPTSLQLPQHLLSQHLPSQYPVAHHVTDAGVGDFGASTSGVAEEVHHRSTHAYQLQQIGMAGQGMDGMDETKKAIAVSSVSDITGCDGEVAVFLLEVNRWNVESAVNHFLESGMGTVMLKDATNPLNPPPLHTQTPTALSGACPPPHTECTRGLANMPEEMGDDTGAAAVAAAATAATARSAQYQTLHGTIGASECDTVAAGIAAIPASVEPGDGEKGGLFVAISMDDILNEQSAGLVPAGMSEHDMLEAAIAASMHTLAGSHTFAPSPTPMTHHHLSHDESATSKPHDSSVTTHLRLDVDGTCCKALSDGGEMSEAPPPPSPSAPPHLPTPLHPSMPPQLHVPIQTHIDGPIASVITIGSPAGDSESGEWSAAGGDDTLYLAVHDIGEAIEPVPEDEGEEDAAELQQALAMSTASSCLADHQRPQSEDQAGGAKRVPEEAIRAATRGIHEEDVGRKLTDGSEDVESKDVECKVPPEQHLESNLPPAHQLLVDEVGGDDEVDADELLGLTSHAALPPPSYQTLPPPSYEAHIKGRPELAVEEQVASPKPEDMSKSDMSKRACAEEELEACAQEEPEALPKTDTQQTALLRKKTSDEQEDAGKEAGVAPHTFGVGAAETSEHRGPETSSDATVWEQGGAVEAVPVAVGVVAADEADVAVPLHALPLQALPLQAHATVPLHQPHLTSLETSKAPPDTCRTPPQTSATPGSQAPMLMAQSKCGEEAPIPWQGLEELAASLGLTKYLGVLQQHGLDDLHELTNLTEDQLKEMQVTIGARRKLLAAVRRLVPAC